VSVQGEYPHEEMGILAVEEGEDDGVKSGGRGILMAVLPVNEGPGCGIMRPSPLYVGEEYE